MAWSIMGDPLITELGAWHEPMPHGATVIHVLLGEPEAGSWDRVQVGPAPSLLRASVSPSVMLLETSWGKGELRHN